MPPTGEIVLQSFSPDALWVATYAEVGFGWRPVQWLSLRLEVGPGLTLARPLFVDAGASNATVFEPSFVVGRGVFVVEFAL